MPGGTGPLQPYAQRMAYNALKAYKELTPAWQNLSKEARNIVIKRHGIDPIGGPVYDLIFGKDKSHKAALGFFKGAGFDFTVSRQRRLHDIRSALTSVLGENVSPTLINTALQDKQFMNRLKTIQSGGGFDDKMQRRIMRGVIGQFAGSVLGQSVDVFRDMGATNWATGVAGASSAAQYGSMGFMVGGPIGAAAGAIGGAVVGVFEELAKQAENLSKQFDTLYRAQQQYSKTLKDFSKSTSFSDWSDSIEKMTDAQLERENTEKKAALDAAKSERTAFSGEITSETFRINKEYLDKLNAAGQDMDSRMKAENEYTEALKRIANKTAALDKKVEDAQKSYDAVNKEYKERQNKEKQFNKAFESDTYSRNFAKFAKTASLEDVEAGIRANEALMQKAAENKNTEDFQKYSNRLSMYENLKERITQVQEDRRFELSLKSMGAIDYRKKAVEEEARYDELVKSGNITEAAKARRSFEAIKQIADIQEESSLELRRMDESYENSRILERYGIGGGAGVRSTMMGYAGQAASERKRYEQLMAEGRLEEAAKAKSSWQFAAGERNSLADTLLQVLGSRTADLTNVTSLASIGANMGERNDNFDRQMAVWEDQRNLQREIKNILSEKTFESTYGE